MRIIAMRGLPGAGKTTIAKQWVDDDPTYRVRVSRDDLRDMLFGGETGHRDDEEMVTHLVIAAIGRATMDHRSIIVDATNINSEHLDLIRRYAETLSQHYPVEFWLWDVVVPAGVCVARDATRDRVVGRKVIERMDQQLAKCEDWRPGRGTRLYRSNW